MTVQDLRPNSQDTSAFYLGNIYQVLADPNVTRASIPSPVAKPPAFSPPRYAVWVNSLWFLSLVMSVSCALWATSLHQWARRYIRLTQPERCSPEKRARMRAFFANGVENMHIPWAVEGLPTLLHLSLFLFFGGLVIFLFNVDHEVFICVVSWIGLFSIVYGLITLLPLIRQDSPYYTPLSIPAWFPYAGIQYLAFEVLASIAPNRFGSFAWSFATWERYFELRNRYHGWMSGGMEKTAEKMASERSPKIDVGILDWTISALGDDDSLEKFIEAIPGFFNSKLVNGLQKHLPFGIARRLSGAMNGFLCRTLSSNSVIEAVKQHRLHISMSAINLVHISGFPSIHGEGFFEHPSVEIGHAFAPWCASKNQRTARYAQGMVSRVLATVRERDDRWVELAARVYGIPECGLRDIINHGEDSVSLTIFIHVTRKAYLTDPLMDVWPTFTRFNIRNTLPGLQHDFCTLWNEIVLEATKQGPYTTPVGFLNLTRRHYIALHQGTDAAPTAFSPSTNIADPILAQPSSYPLCNIASHRRYSTAHVYVPLLTQPVHSPDALPHHHTWGSTVSRQVVQASTTAGLGPPPLSYPKTPNKINASSQFLTSASLALPVLTSPRPTDVSPPGAVAIALQDISQAAASSYPLGKTTQRDIVAPCAVSENLSIMCTPAPTPTATPVPASTSSVLNKPLESCDAGAASTSNPSLSTSSVVGFSIPICPPPPPPSPNAESFALHSSTTPSRPASNVTLPRLVRARGLVNTGSMCFTNSVLQMLVHSPQFCNMFRELGSLKGLHGEGPETGATPLVAATVRFFEEFVSKEKELPPQQPSQQAAGGMPREDEEAMKEYNVVDSFEPVHMYDAMKEKRRLKMLLVSSRPSRPFVTDLC